MDADGRKEGLKLVDGSSGDVDFEVDGGGGAAGLIGAIGIDHCAAYGDDPPLELAGE